MTQTALTPRAWTELLLLSLLWGGSFLAIRISLDTLVSRFSQVAS